MSEIKLKNGSKIVTEDKPKNFSKLRGGVRRMSAEERDSVRNDRYSVISQEINLLSSKVQERKAELKTLTHKLGNLKQEQREFDDRNAKSKISVTDHAVVRYLERFMNIDTNTIKTEIRELYVSGSNKVKFKVANGQIRTII